MKNEYEIRGDVTAIIIKSKKHGMQESLISTESLNRVKECPYSWFVSVGRNKETLYVRANEKKENGKQKIIYLHRWIMNAPRGLVVDHINHNTLDNTNTNLRIVTQAENNQNLRGTRSNNTSGIRGVSWHKRAKKWSAQMCVNGNNKTLGIFSDIKEAEKAVMEARYKYMPFSNEDESI